MSVAVSPRRLIALILLTAFWPPLAFAQAPKAGVITTVEGNVTARRVALPSPVPLKFKDDVFLQDTVTTGDNSLARMLLGGKAVVTVRERSVLTITEVPGKSTIELETGKFAMAVAREKLRPDEEILIRTPNAIAGVRGTVVVTEVSRQGAQVGGAIPAAVTSFYVLRGTITVQGLDPATRQALGALTQVGTLQAYTAVGSALPRVVPVPPAQVSQINAGLQPTGPKGGQDAGQEQVKTQVMQAAVTLLGAFGGTQVRAGAARQPTVRPAPPSQRAPLLGRALFEKRQALFNTIQEFLDLVGLPAQITGTLTVVDPLRTFRGRDTRSAFTDPLVTFINANVTQTGDDDLFFIRPGANLTLAGPFARAINSTITTGGLFLSLENATLTSTTTQPLISFDPVTLTALDGLVEIEGGVVRLAGPLFTDTGGTLKIGTLLGVSDGAKVTSTTTAPLISLTNTKLTTSDLFELAGSDTLVSLAGPLLKLSGVTLTLPTGTPTFPLFNVNRGRLTSTAKDPHITLLNTNVTVANNFFLAQNNAAITLAGTLLSARESALNATSAGRSFFVVTDGASITTAGTDDPLFSFIGTASSRSAVTAARNGFTVAQNATGPGSLTLSGPFLNATLTDFRTGNPTANTFSFLFIGDGAQVRSTSASPFMTFTNSTLDTAGNILTLRRSTPSTPSRLTLAGPLLVANNSSFNHTSLGFGTSFGTSASACCNAFSITQGAQLTSTGTSALIQLTDSAVVGADAQSGGNFFGIQDTVVGFPATEVVAPATVSLAGPLLQMVNSSITALFNVVFVQRSTLTSTSASSLIDITGGSVSLGGTDPTTGSAVGGSLLFVRSSNVTGQAGAPTAVNLAGSLARLTGTTVSMGTTNPADVVAVLNGAALTSTGSGALLQLTNATMSGFNLLSVGGLGGPAGTTLASVTSAGPILSATNSTITLASNVIGVFNAGRFTATTTSPLIQLTGTTLTAGTSFSGAEVLQANGGASPALVSLRGPVLSAASGSSVTTPGALLGTFAGGQVVVTSSTDPLFRFSGGTHSFGTAVGSDRDAAFILNGLATETASEVADTVPLTLGTRKAVQHSGALLEGSGATLTSKRGLVVDTALHEATAPIFDLKAGTTYTTSVDSIDLVQKAKLTSVGPVIKLDASTLTVSSGAAVLVQGGSNLRITAGDLFTLLNGSTLRALNGPLLRVIGGSVVNISGFFAGFGGTGNVVSVNANGLCAPCSPNPVVAAINGGTFVGPGTLAGLFRNFAGGTVTVPAGAALIVVDGSPSKLTITGD